LFSSFEGWTKDYTARDILAGLTLAATAVRRHSCLRSTALSFGFVPALGGHAHAMERRYHASRLGGFEVYDEFVPCTGWSAG
jgi:hypothetical protein